jgi:hypothetical protein
MNIVEKYYIWIFGLFATVFIALPYRFAKAHPSIYMEYVHGVRGKIINIIIYLFIFTAGLQIGSFYIFEQIVGKEIDIKIIHEQFGIFNYIYAGITVFVVSTTLCYNAIEVMAKKIIEHENKDK